MRARQDRPPGVFETLPSDTAWNRIMTLADDTVLARGDTVLHADLVTAVAMMNIETGEYYNLNPVGSRIWSLLETPQSLAAICDALTAEFAVPAQTCRDETAAFLADLLDRKIVRRV